jgi:hypothetical protein
LYYPNVFSALQIPAGLALDESLLSYLQADNELMRNVRAGISLEDLYTYKSEGLVRRFSDLNMNQEIFKAHIAYIVSPERPTIDRGLEFETLTGPSYNSQVLDTEKKEIEIYGAQITKLFDTVVAVRGLTETRVQTGFSRLGANAEDRSGYPMLWGEPTLGANGMSGVDWLPATRGRGEGIMLTLKRSEIDKWAKRQSDGAVATTRDGILLTNRLTVVHTLSHLLISVMAPRSGYALASIRERIYDLPDKGIGVLLYVTEADTLGTMGGLVRLAEPDELNDIVFAALNAARWCQLDPVCITGGIEHNRQSGACHQCCLLPETCCEYANQGLDRRALIGSPAGVPSAQGFLE